VTVDVERLVVWPALDCSGDPVVLGADRPAQEPAPQRAPKKGTRPASRLTQGGRQARLDAPPARLLA
jgi:hypothetical protein